MHRTAEERLWARTRRLTVALLLLWLLVSVVGPWFARDLNKLLVFGFPAGYWVAAQGALIAFLAIIGLCVWGMERLETRYEAERAAQAAAEAASQITGAAPSELP
jgi:putative solute:sodium symporter small subunit